MDAGRLLQQLLIHRIVKCQLENPCTVAQIDKYKIAKVTYFLYNPAATTSFPISAVVSCVQ